VFGIPSARDGIKSNPGVLTLLATPGFWVKPRGILRFAEGVGEQILGVDFPSAGDRVGFAAPKWGEGEPHGILGVAGF
jgi:hypothetical protein